MVTTHDADREVGARASRTLVVDDLAGRRGERVLFRDFSLAVAPGELVWLRAANGYGKTTLLRILAGLARPEAGTFRWSDTQGPALVYLAHANALKDDLTVLESVRYQSTLHGLDASEPAIADAIRRFGLQARRHAPVRTLSQGQRRRVALTRLCLSDPQSTWLLDEPWDALDADGVALVSALLDEHAARGGNALFTSHVPPVLASLRTVQFDAPARSVA